MINMRGIFATSVAVLLCAPACGAEKLADGDAVQQRIEIKRPGIPVPTTKPQVDVEPKETNEQRLRRLANDASKDKCLELLKKALGAETVEYNEAECSIKFTRTSGTDHLKAYFERADTIAGPKGISFTCRRKNGGKCVSSGQSNHGFGDLPQTVGWQYQPSANVTGAQACLDRLHNRCKQM